MLGTVDGDGERGTGKNLSVDLCCGEERPDVDFVASCKVVFFDASNANVL